jgi:hypothetical protein
MIEDKGTIGAPAKIDGPVKTGEVVPTDEVGKIEEPVGDRSRITSFKGF